MVIPANWKLRSGIWWHTAYPMACALPSTPGGVNHSHPMSNAAERVSRTAKMNFSEGFAKRVVFMNAMIIGLLPDVCKEIKSEQ